MKISQNKFKQWLLAKHPRTNVGTRRDESNCPLAKFLTQTTRNRFLVGAHFMIMDGHWPNYNLPPWVRKFINQIDKSPYKSISAKRALHILDSI